MKTSKENKNERFNPKIGNVEKDSKRAIFDLAHESFHNMVWEDLENFPKISYPQNIAINENLKNREKLFNRLRKEDDIQKQVMSYIENDLQSSERLAQIKGRYAKDIILSEQEIEVIMNDVTKITSFEQMIVDEFGLSEDSKPAPSESRFAEGLFTCAGLLYDREQREDAIDFIKEKYDIEKAKYGTLNARLWLLRDVIKSFYPVVKLFTETKFMKLLKWIGIDLIVRIFFR